jgi:AraC-like DNA-binding protein
MDTLLFDFSQKSSLLLIFFFHGLVFSILLFRKGYQNDQQESRWLAGLILLCTLYISPFMLGYAGWYTVDLLRDILFYLPFQQLFLLGPVLYFYVQSLLNPSFRIKKKDFLHFLPGFLYLVFILIVFITDKIILKDYYFYADGRDMDLDFWYQFSGLISMVFYLFLSLRFYARYREMAFATVSFAEAILFNWIRRFLLAFLLILLLRVLFFILNPEWGEFGSKFWYYLCFSLLFYYISISGYLTAVRGEFPLSMAVFQTENTGLELPKSSPSKTSLSKTTPIEDLENWKAQIEELMQVQRIFENPSLTLREMAQLLDTNSKQVSQVINQGFQKNFNDFVNDYRTEAMIGKLKAGEHQQKSLLGLALDCGFNSKSTFNRAFKKATNKTPRRFIEEMT